MNGDGLEERVEESFVSMQWDDEHSKGGAEGQRGRGAAAA